MAATRIHIAGHSVGLLMFFFGVAALSRAITAKDAKGKPAGPQLITGGANALSNLFTNTIK